MAKIAPFLKKVREAKVPVVYTSFAPGNASLVPILPELAPQPGEPVSLDHFVTPELDGILKKAQASTVIMVGYLAESSIYNAKKANDLGYTVVVAEDGIVPHNEFGLLATRYFLLNHQPGVNADNKPLAPKATTLSRTDLISFK